jgi:hypothetical protein
MAHGELLTWLKTNDFKYDAYANKWSKDYIQTTSNPKMVNAFKIFVWNAQDKWFAKISNIVSERTDDYSCKPYMSVWYGNHSADTPKDAVKAATKNALALATLCVDALSKTLGIDVQ